MLAYGTPNVVEGQWQAKQAGVQAVMEAKTQVLEEFAEAMEKDSQSFTLRGRTAVKPQYTEWMGSTEYVKPVDMVGLSQTTSLCSTAWQSGTVTPKWQTRGPKGPENMFQQQGVHTFQLPGEGLPHGIGE